MTQFKVGDKVRFIKTDNCCKERIGETGKVLTIRNDKYPILMDFDFGSGAHSDVAESFELVEEPKTMMKYPQVGIASLGGLREMCIELQNKSKKSKIMNLIEKAKMLVKGEPDKSLIEKGITDMDGNLTQDGQVLFNDYQWRTNKVAFVADPAVAALLAEKNEK